MVADKDLRRTQYLVDVSFNSHGQRSARPTLRVKIRHIDGPGSRCCPHIQNSGGIGREWTQEVRILLLRLENNVYDVHCVYRLELAFVSRS